jgi:hypothetical protein
MRHFDTPRWLRYGVLTVPFAYPLADYGENVGITAMVLTPPHHLVGVAETTAWFNVAKGYPLEVTVAVITVSYLAVLLRRLAKHAFRRRTP